MVWGIKPVLNISFVKTKDISGATTYRLLTTKTYLLLQYISCQQEHLILVENYSNNFFRQASKFGIVNSIKTLWLLV